MTGERRREDLVPRDELEAALAARRELGPEYETEIANSLAERIEERLEARLRERVPVRRGTPPLALAVISMAFAIPLLGIAAGTAGLPGIVAVCTAIVLVNLFAARG